MNLEVIRIDAQVEDASRFENVLKELKNHYKGIKFLGWINGFHVIEINHKKYKVTIPNGSIQLKETTAKNVIIPARPVKQDAFEKYNKILKE